MKDLTLLDLVMLKMNCKYLSDLHYLTESDKLRLFHYLSEKVRLDSATLYEWNEVLNYLTGLPAMRTREEAKIALLNALV